MICDGALGLESVLSLLARIKVILGVKLWRFCRCHLILRVRPWFWIRRSILPRRQILLFDIFHGLDAVRGNEFFGFVETDPDEAPNSYHHQHRTCDYGNGSLSFFIHYGPPFRFFKYSTPQNHCQIWKFNL